MKFTFLQSVISFGSGYSIKEYLLNLVHQQEVRVQIWNLHLSKQTNYLRKTLRR